MTECPNVAPLNYSPFAPPKPPLDVPLYGAAFPSPHFADSGEARAIPIAYPTPRGHGHVRQGDEAAFRHHTFWGRLKDWTLRALPSYNVPLAKNQARKAAASARAGVSCHLQARVRAA